MGLEKSSLDLPIESPPSPLCRDLAEFQYLYKQLTVCDSDVLKRITPAGEFLASDFF